MNLSNSPVSAHTFNGMRFHLKRDDLLHPNFSGNKARKFMSLLSHGDPAITHLISYGSVQANSLLSLAALAQIKHWQLEYYVGRIPKWLRAQPIGNYRRALELGAKVTDLSALSDRPVDPEAYIAQRLGAQCLFVPEGGRFAQAQIGVAKLAEEIRQWASVHAQKPLTVALPSGTGTTALFLHKHLAQHGIEVVTCACVGGRAYLMAQMAQLGEVGLPTILTPPTKHHFGKLYPEQYQLWQSLSAQTQVEFDLLYDPLMWRCLLDYLPNIPARQLLYIHQGGIVGNESMRLRYRRYFDQASRSSL